MIAKNQKGLAPVIIVVIIAVLAIGGFFLFRGKNTPQASTATTSNNELKDYFNPVERVKFKYPEDWKAQEFTKDSIIKFMVAKDAKADFRFTSGDAFEKDSKVKEYTSDVKAEYDKQQVEGLSKIPGFSLISQSDTTINNMPFHQIEFTTNMNNQKIHTYQMWTVKNNRNYGFAYNATPENYDEFLPVAKNIFNTVEVF